MLGTPQPYNFKNRIINGAMTIDQRNAGASITNNGTITQYSVDRWNIATSVSSKFTVQQDAGAVTPPAGFRDYLGITSTAATSLGASDYYLIRQQIEGFNTADLNYGTANAQTVTLSFWVRSSLTGSFGGALTNDADAWCPFSYTISAANTWEYKTITLVGATIGTWNTTNGQGLSVRFSLGIGSNFTGGTAGAWSSSIFSQPSGSTSVVGTNGATFYITGVQLELGVTATSFDFRSIGTELQLCQRYFTRFSNGAIFTPYGMAEAIGTTSVRWNMQCPVALRSTPTLSVAGSGLVWSLDRVGTVLSNFTLAQSSTLIQSITANTANGITAGQIGSITAGNFTDTSISFSAEL
jgi:hypothetical protein